MRVLIDTNVLISAVLSANGVPYQAYVKAGADVLITGDKDFLESGLEKLVIVTPADKQGACIKPSWSRKRSILCSDGAAQR